MNIAYVSRFESLDIKNWSGTEYFISKAIEKKNNLSFINGFDDNVNLWTRLKNKYYTRNGSKYLVNRSPSVAQNYAKQIISRLPLGTDIVFSPGTIPIAYLKTKHPKVFYTDATFANMLNYYDWFDNLSLQTIKESMDMEQHAIDSSSLAIYSSDWAAQSAINDYKANPDKVKVIPFGANIETSCSYEEVVQCIRKRSNKVCKILFMGVDWLRKGGDIVLKTVQHLNELGLPTELHIVGIKDNVIDKYPFIVNHGFIDKSTSAGRIAIQNIMLESHFLFMPSKAEAYGIVFCEASAYGVPSIATRTGGISTIVKDHVNGMTFAENTNIELYTDFIRSVFLKPNVYEDLAKSSYNEYMTRLNWRTAGDTLTNYMKELL